MFCWPCIVIHPCNENQLDALFILSLFCQLTSTCFRHICNPSSAGTLYVYSNLYLCWKEGCLKILERIYISLYYVKYIIAIWGTALAQWLRCCATNQKVTVPILAGVIGIFNWHKILPITLWPWSRLSLQQKWVPAAFPGGKGGRC